MNRVRIGWNWGWLKVSRHKSLEWSFGRRLATDPFSLSARWTLQGDHAGFRFWFSIWRLFFVEVNLTDARHWNWEEGRFYTEQESALQEAEWAALDAELGEVKPAPAIATITVFNDYPINSLGDNRRGKLN
jgi:hypothetical protein